MKVFNDNAEKIIVANPIAIGSVENVASKGVNAIGHSPDSKHNFKAFIWHGLFLALASNFMDVNMVIPSMLLKMGASSFHLGVLTAIMLGGSSFMQLAFSLMLQKYAYKKKWILLGINVRVLMLLSMAILFYFNSQLSPLVMLALVYLFITVFSLSGSFSNVSYVDLIGKTINQPTRKRFFSLKQLFNAAGILVSAIMAGFILRNSNYPENYFYLFLIATILLAISSIGFWNIKESSPSGKNIRSLRSFNDRMMKELRENYNLRYYLLIINTLGTVVSIVPFLIMLSKNNAVLTFDKVGDFLIFQTIGMIAGSLILFLSAKRYKNQQVLIFDVILAIVILIAALVLQGSVAYFHYIFILTGLFTATYKVITDGILVEISNNDNRTLYTGISGAGNLLPMIVPILVGYLLKYFSFEIIFSAIILILLLGLIPVLRLKCHKQ